jgi:hypothetical protein
MKTPPNRTVVTGRLQKFEPAVDGYGGDLEIEVVSNVSPDPSADFIRPEAGKQLRAFYPEPSEREISLLIGRFVRVDLTFLGGTRGRAKPQGGLAAPVNRSFTADLIKRSRTPYRFTVTFTLPFATEMPLNDTPVELPS